MQTQERKPTGLDSLSRGTVNLGQPTDWMEDFIFTIGPDLRACYVNACAAKFLGREPRDILGKPLSEVFPANKHQNLKDNLQKVFASGRTCRFEQKISSSEGSLWLDTSLTPIHDGSGAVLAVLAIARDISAAKQQQALITCAKQEWERAVDSISYLFAVVNRHYRIRRVNAALARRLGVDVREASGMLCYDKLHGTDKPLPGCPLLQSLPHGEEYTAEICEQHLGNTYVVTASALTDRRGKLIGCVYVAREASQREKVVEERSKSSEAMRLLMKHADHIVCVQDRKGAYLFCASSPDHGICAEEFIGKTPFDCFESTRASRLVERVIGACTTGQSLTELVEVSCDGDTWHFFEHVSPIRIASGAISSVITISRKLHAGKQLPTRSDHPSGSVHGLTTREVEVLKLIASGLTNREIAAKLFISAKTVATHRARLMNKLDIHKSSALVNYAIKSGLL
jgi:PAS domain S-box-containing protein